MLDYALLSSDIYSEKFHSNNRPPGRRENRKYFMPPKTGILVAVLLLVCGILLASPAEAASVDGSASVWTYFRDDSVDHVLIIPTLSLTFKEFAGDDWRIETSLRGYSDLRNGEAHNEQIRILRGVVIFAPARSNWEVRLGQQWLTEGVGRGNVAGPWIKHKFGKSSLTIYGGARLQNSYSFKVPYPTNGIALGAHARARAGGTKLGASYFFLGSHGDMLFHAAGVEANTALARTLSAHARFDLNLGQSTIETAQLLADWTPAKPIQFTGEFRVHTPRVFDDSYFTRFLEDASLMQLRGGARWNFYEDFYVKGLGQTLFTDFPDLAVAFVRALPK